MFDNATHADRDGLADLLLLAPEDVKEAGPVLGSTLMMLGLYAARTLSDSRTDPLDWGAYQTERALGGQWWRVVTYGFVYDDAFKLFSDAVAVMLFGTALTKLQSSSMAFAAFRLGLFVGLLGVAAKAPRDQVVTSVSGPAYCMLGAFLTTAALNQRRWRITTPRDKLATGGLGLTLLALVLRPHLSAPATVRAQGYATLAGVGAAGLAHVVRAVDRRKSSKQA